MAHQERVNLAVFIDFDNIEIGVKTTLGEHFDIGTILEALKERGEVVTKIAYADWTRAGEYSRALTQHAIRLVQRNLTPGGDKNGADINLALDALEMAFTHPHINAYVIVGGDSDFLSLVEKLKQYDKKVFVVGGRAFTSIILQRNCHEFIAYENLVRKPSARGGRPPAPMATTPIAQAFPIVRRAIKILADREVSPQTGLLKSTLLQLDSTFSERSYGASSFLDFTEKLQQAGLIQLKHSGRSVMVELNHQFPEESDAARAVAATPAESSPDLFATAPTSDVPQAASQGAVSNGLADGAANGTANGASVSAPNAAQAPYVPAPRLGEQADGVRIAGELLANATTARWPMYLRNAKQILRASNFDERRYGFSGLIELLKACQRESLLRIERDRRGGLRVFQGPSLARNGNIAPPAAPVAAPIDLQMDGDDIIDEPQPFSLQEPLPIVDGNLTDADPDVADADTIAVVDTTAQLLGRAKPKPRARSRGTNVVGEDEPAPPRAARGARKGTRKTAASGNAAPRRSRAKKSE